MLTRQVAVMAGALLLAIAATAQDKLLIDPSQAPITLKGGWERKTATAGRGAAHGPITVKISKINPDGTFEGRLDLINAAGTGVWCQARDEPIKEGRITAKGITVVANGGAPAVCGMMTLNFRLGQDKWLQGRISSEAEPKGAPMWLDAPK
jgi:hypothetical protein